MTDSSRLLASLAEHVGAAHVLVNAADLAPYLAETRGLRRGHALAVVRPADTAAVAGVVRTCAEAGVPVVAQGGNTGHVGGGLPQGGIVLSLARLNRLRALDPVNASITVEAGMVLADVQAAARDAGMLFPLSLASEGSCRIGGNLSTNAGGTAVLAYGNARDLVLGLEVVLADGRVWNGLKGLRKDNAGYDLKQLFLGSEGTLGLVTAAVLKLHPRPLSRSVAFLGLASAEAALALFVALRAEAGAGLTAFEYVAPFGLEIVLRHRAGARRPLAGRHAAYALVEVSTTRPGEDAGTVLEPMLARAQARGLVEDAVLAASEAQALALWDLRESLSEVQKAEGASIKHDVSVPLSRLPEFLARATRACEAELPSLRVCAFGHFGDGNIHFNLSQPVDMDRAAFLALWDRFNRIVHDIVLALGGSIAAEHGVGLLKRAELGRTADPVALDLMRTLKAALDPMNILNPGKILPDPTAP